MACNIHKNSTKRACERMLASALCLLLLAGLTVSAAPGQPVKDKYDVGGGSQTEAAAELQNYWELLEEYAEKGYQPGEGSYCSTEWTGIEAKEDIEGYSGLAYQWDEEQESIQTTIQIEKAGLYVLALDYLTLPGEVASIQRGLLVDGESICEDSENIPFDRKWKESGDTFYDYNGDERSPQLEQVCQWNKQYFGDTNAFYSRPLEVYLTAGEHTITLVHVSGNMVVGSLYVEPPAVLPTYEEYLGLHNASDYTGETLYLEAEQAEYRSDRTIRRISDSDPASSPFEYSLIRLNTIGGDRWQTGGQYLTWKVDVPETGYYQINTRFLQTTGNGLVIYRQLLINGEVPFQEADAVPFLYGSSWQTAALGSDEEPYRIYLEAGEQEITLRVVSGELRDVQNSLKECGEILSDLLRDILTIVGSTPDPNFEYELDKKISWLIPTLENLRDELRSQAERLLEISGKQATVISNLMSAADELDGYIRHPETIPVSSGSDGSLTNMQTNLSTWYTEILSMPMTLDFLELAAPGSPVKEVKSSFFQRAKATFMNFIASFVKDYNQLGGDIEGTEITDEITVWIARGREWGELLQQMADEEYTPRTGVRVRINILPTGSVGAIGGVSPLLLSIVTGNSPNLAIGSDSSTPVELAIRESVVELSQLPGYEELASYFVPGALEPFVYNDGVYALPETMDFQFMMVRTDIFDELHLEIPEDWDTLYAKVLPSLKQHNYNFYIPITTSTTAQYQYCAFYTYLWQLNGDLYDETGLNTLLNSETAYSAFYQWVRSYTQYNLPSEINTFNHFRVGDIPIFVGGLNEYLTLKVAAPELYGKWEVARIPGTRNEDGSLNRQAIGALTSCIMFDKAEGNEAAWEFLQWYMSADVQQRYGEDIEATVGLQARWFTANTEAFSNLPWDKEDLQVFEEAMLDMRNPRNVLGGYITGRQINNAWTRAVMNGQEPRVALEEAVKEIERELKRKQDEYGIGGGN